ncbi:MAG: hypothetical protein H8E18_04205 [FCB group bacterium]|nr:hypothetical protein [FCB group bacterium]
MAKIVRLRHYIIILGVLLPIMVFPLIKEETLVRADQYHSTELLVGINSGVMGQRIKSMGFQPIYGVMGVTINLRVNNLTGMVANFDKFALLNRTKLDKHSVLKPYNNQTRINLGIQKIINDEQGRGILELKYQILPENGFIYSIGGEGDISRQLRYKILLNYFPQWNLIQLFFKDDIRSDWSVTVGLYYNFE